MIIEEKLLNKLSYDKNFKAIIEIAKIIKHFKGQTLITGGAVRDNLLGITPKDWDLEVFNIEPKKLLIILSKYFNIFEVGKSFGVFKIDKFNIDISIPRNEILKGSKHTDFLIQHIPKMSLLDASYRRDFTINSIFWDPLNNKIIDPLNGCEDLKKKILKHIGKKFIEDPLRVLRAMQLSARFIFDIDSSTINICKQMHANNLSKERIFEEWTKLILKGKKISKGLNFLKECGWINYYPELNALINCEQEKEWHPEGDVWTHTLHALDAFAEERDIIDDKNENLIVGLAILCHDLGKPVSSFIDKTGKIRSFAHEIKGYYISKIFLKKLTNQKKFIDDISILVLTHMRPVELFNNNASDSAIKRLSVKVNRLDRLLRVVSADLQGCPPRNVKDFIIKIQSFFYKKMKILQIEKNAPKPILKGRHLIKLGYLPSKNFGIILKKMFVYQLEGKFNDENEGLIFLQKYIDKNCIYLIKK